MAKMSERRFSVPEIWTKKEQSLLADVGAHFRADGVCTNMSDRQSRKLPEKRRMGPEMIKCPKCSGEDISRHQCFDCGFSQKVAVFTTSDIQGRLAAVKRLVDSPPRIETVELRGQKETFASYGKLEKALSMGYKVYVVTSRHEMGSQDQWWIKLVGSDNCVMAKNYGSSTCENCIQEWKNFIQNTLGLEPNTEAHSWMDLMYGLKEHGIKLGSEFR